MQEKSTANESWILASYLIGVLSSKIGKTKLNNPSNDFY